MHKHFRLLSIRDNILQTGVATDADAHIKSQGLWVKLESQYNLTALDEREDSITNGYEDENGDSVDPWHAFSLPEEEYGEAMFEKRINPDGSNSPSLDLSGSRRGSKDTVADSEEPGSSPAPGRRSARSTKGTRGGRVSRLQEEAEAERGSRRSSKAASVAEDVTMGEDDDEEEEEDDDDGEVEKEEEKGTPRPGRGGRGGRARGTAARGRAGTTRGKRKR